MVSESFKLCVLIILLMFLAMRGHILYMFIIFQQIFRIEQLPIEMDSYRKSERTQILTYKAMTLLFIACMIAVIIGFTIKYDVWLAMAWTWLTHGLCILASANMNLTINFWLILSEYRYHRLEFK